jgi:hypothetical protein
MTFLSLISSEIGLLLLTVYRDEDVVVVDDDDCGMKGEKT